MTKPYLLNLDIHDAYSLVDALNLAVLTDAHIGTPDEESGEVYVDHAQRERWLALAAQLDTIIHSYVPDGFENREDFQRFIRGISDLPG